MVVKVTRSYTEDIWYKDFIGKNFPITFVKDGFYFFSSFLYFFPGDVKIVNESVDAVPIYVLGKS